MSDQLDLLTAVKALLLTKPVCLVVHHDGCHFCDLRVAIAAEEKRRADLLRDSAAMWQGCRIGEDELRQLRAVAAAAAAFERAVTEDKLLEGFYAPLDALRARLFWLPADLRAELEKEGA